MLFRRRATLPLHKRAMASLWPTNGFDRSLRYFRMRLVRMRANPYAIAMGFACGVFVSFTPLMGFHVALALLLAYLMNGNYGAALIGTIVGNPLTFPLIWTAIYRVGLMLLGEPAQPDVDPALLAPNPFSLDAVQAFLERTWPHFKPMLLGGVVLGTLAAAAAYALSYGLVVTYQKAKAARHKVHDHKDTSQAGSSLSDQEQVNPKKEGTA